MKKGLFGIVFVAFFGYLLFCLIGQEKIEPGQQFVIVKNTQGKYTPGIFKETIIEFSEGEVVTADGFRPVIGDVPTTLLDILGRQWVRVHCYCSDTHAAWILRSALKPIEE